MKIGIFTKYGMAGGSEFRGIEMANGIVNHTKNDAYILAIEKVTPKLKQQLHPNVPIFENVLTSNESAKIFYDMNSILVINSDSKSFTTRDFWEGKTDQTNAIIDLTKIKQMNFLFNFLISPSIKLQELQPLVKDVRILTTNKKFFNEVSKQDRYTPVRHFPRMILNSPIRPETINTSKTKSDKIRLGMHSKGVGNKWNTECADLIKRINDKIGAENLKRDFMGAASHFRKSVEGIPNVILRREFTLPVKEYLSNIDIFLFYPHWNREEPWSRSVAEGIASGCPVITTNKGGNIDQVITGNTGFLCDNLDEFEKAAMSLIEEQNIREQMIQNSLRISKSFLSKEIIRKFFNFIKD